MTVEHYNKLRRSDDPRRVYHVEETPPEIAEMFADKINKLAQRKGYDD